uniref:centromere-associated protein E isoform X5 n=1 Tax=Epinephelus lanceolatus TaxID=310571 RepID=UPI0014485870|nr:centromere-associated protein E isoform X5 [Epinephelus lanceolatus]
MTEESAVKVCIRVRPLIAREESAESEDAEPVHLFWKADKKSIHQIDDGNSTKSFSFDRVFTAEETTNQLYQNIAKPLVVSTVEGYNGTIFAYGQTSSGKTFTMMGSDRSPGVIPLAVEDVFQTIKNCPKKEFLLRVSYMEIYNETVTDLLVDSWKRKPLEVRETINKNIYVADLTEELVTSPAQALAWIRKGEKNRHYGKTKMNQRSSRSHTIFRMILESRERSDPASGENADGAIIVSHLNLVDLAGSERASQTGAEGTRFKEGCNINRSLFTLGQVIKKLTDESQKGFTNYRDSKLTRILQNSLGGNAKTVIIGTITPVALDETLSTLQFASTAKKMKNDPHVTEVSDDGALLKRYRNEIVDLKRRLHEVSSVTQTTATEKEVLSQLLQEKDQLQREQEDRIKNLTKLLVTSTNQVPAQKMPKRRVTWGGKMLRLARPSACDGGSSDLSFADPFTRKRKASNVSLMELVEDDEDFDSHWEIPDEPSDDMEISQSSVTVRSFGDSPKDFVSPDRVHELSGKVSSLQLQLQTEVQQKQEALEKVAMLDLRVADLERRLEEQNNTKTDEQMGKQFAEAIQLCETLASEKDVVEVERDYLKQELGMFLEQIETLEKEKAALSKEMEEKREMEEFKALEEEFRKEQEIQRLTEELESVRAERDSLLSGKEASCQTSTEEMEKLLCRVTSLTEERDQLQEILEGLRQEKQQLKAELEDKMEMVAQVQCGFNQPEGLASELHQQDAQVTHLQQEIEQLQATLQAVSEQKSQLEVDLQHNMEMAAETQSLLHSLQQELQEQNQRNADLERLSQERQAQLEQEVARTQSLLHSLEDEHQELKQNNSDHMKLCEQKESGLEQQIAQLNMSLQAVTEQKRQVEYDLQQNINMASTTRELLKSVQEELCEQKQMNSDLEKKESSFDQQVRTLTEKLESIEAERDSLLSEKEASCQTSTDEMEKLLCRVTSLSEERDQLQETLEGLRQEKQQLKAELEDRMERMQCELQQQLSSEPQSLKEEQEAQTLLQIQQLEEHLEKTKEEVSQLKSDLQENVELMIENQEELRESQEKIRVLKDEISMLKSQKAELEGKASNGSDADISLQMQELQTQIQRLTEELESVRAERDGLLSGKEASCQTSKEEMEKLLCRVTSLTEERDQLQEALEGLRQEKQQLRAELEDRMETMQTEIAQLNMSLQAVTEQKRQVEYDLQQNMNMASTTQELLKSVQEELCEQKQMNSDLEKLCQEKESSFDQQVRTLTEKLKSIEAERDSLLSEKEASCQTSTEEMEKLLCRVTSLTEERDQLQEILEGLRQEKQQFRAELEDRMEMISGIQERLSEQENLNSQQQPERGEQETKLQRRVQQLEEQLQTYRERHSHAEAEAETSQQLLSEAKTTISALKEQLSSLEQSTSRVKETASSRLQDSTRQLQESFKKFQHLIDTCSKYNSTALDKVQCSLKHPYLASLPKPTMNAYSTVCQLQLQTTQSLGNIMEHLQVRAQGYRNLFEELVKKDLAVFEERRLQDVLLCRAQAPCYSVRDEDFHTLWHHRLTELLNKRQLYLQKMASISSTLCANMASYPSELSAEIRHRERFKEQLQTLLNKQPFSLSGLDSILSSELDHRSSVAHNRKMILQGIIDEQNGLFEELKLLEAQADLQFREERSKSSTLLQALEGAPLKTELSLLKDNQQLVLQLQQTEEQVEALRVHNKQLEEAQIKANNRVSNHKQATQLLQTELQDTRAQVEDKDNAIQALRSKLRESEKNASPSAVELEKLRTKLFKMEVELSSASDNHKKEIQQMTTLMNQKEESLRKLKETLRKSQQEGEESFLQGEDLHARLTNPRGLVIKSSVVLEKTKLEEEVKQLQLKITELESLVSSQQVEINKWKSRAFKLKVKSKAEVDRPPSPCTPTKRGLPLTSDPSNFLSSPKKFLVTPRKVLDSPRKVLDSPRKVLDSPKVSVLDSPKSRFFDVGGSSEVLSRTCPKQFFDNSSLGTIPEVFDVPDEPDADMDAAAGAGRKDWWPQSPKQEEMCKTQ